MYEKVEKYHVTEAPPTGYMVHGEWEDDVHHLHLEIMFDFANQSIVSARAWAEKAPFSECSQGLNSIDKLVGTRVGPGFTKVVKSELETPDGCMHLAELVIGSVRAALQGSSRTVPDWVDEKDYDTRWKFWESLYRGRCIHFARAGVSKEEVRRMTGR